MYSKEPLWLMPGEIVQRFEEFCFLNNINERRLAKLYDAFLLRGRSNRKTKKLEILLESFEDLQIHIKYNLLKQGSKSEAKVKIPIYCKIKYRIPYDRGMSWYTPTEILKTYSDYLKYEKLFTIEFVGELVQMKLITGSYNTTENCYYILLPSFVEMMKLREHCIRQYLILPPPDYPQA